MLEPEALAVLIAAALATSALSAVVGMAGGIVLLAVMLLYMEPLVAIPLHGAVQLVSNGTRTLVQRRHVEWPLLLRFGALLLPAAFAGLGVARALPAGVTRLLIGLFVLLATWFPRVLMLGTHPERLDPQRRMVTLGGVVGFFSTTIGATGPLMAPFFLDLGLSRQGLVGTKAACQTLQHLAKIAVFGVAGFAFGAWLAPLALLAIAVVAGTWLGSRILERVSERVFLWLYRGVLTAIAARLILVEAAALWPA